MGVLIGAYHRGVRRRLVRVGDGARACPRHVNKHNTQRSLPHLARTSASTVVVLPMAVSHTSSIVGEAEPCAYQTGRDGCSSHRGDAGGGGYCKTSDNMKVRWLCIGSKGTADRLSD